MPNYPGTLNSYTRPTGAANLPTALYPGDEYLAFNQEAPVALSSSIACALPLGAVGTAAGIIVEVESSGGDPGVLSLGVQVAGTDADAEYRTPANATFTIAAFVQNGAVFSANSGLIPVGGMFVRILVNAVGNIALPAKPLTVRVRRIQ